MTVLWVVEELMQEVYSVRRGGRAVEGARLEIVYTGNRIEGSNPSLSAINIGGYHTLAK